MRDYEGGRLRRFNWSVLLLRGASVFLLVCFAPLVCSGMECTPEQLIGGLEDNATGRPSIDVGPFGTAWVVWDGADSTGNVYWCVDDGAGWSEQARLGGGTRPVVSVDSTGTPWVVWRVSGGLVSKRWTGSSWTDQEVVAPGISRSGAHDVLALSPDDIWVASEDGANNESQIWAYHWNGVEWGGPWELGLFGRWDGDPDLAVSSNGVVGLVWTTHDLPLGPCEIIYSEWDGSGWTAPAGVDTGDGYRRFPKLAYDGWTPMVLWQHETDVGPDIVYSRSEEGGWSYRAKVSLPDGGMDWDNGLRCESNVAGDIVAVWHNYNGSQMWETPVVCSWWDGGTWSPEEKLSNDDPYKLDQWPDAALDSDGVLWTAWHCYEELVSFDELIHGTTCVRDLTPVDFAFLEAASDGPDVRLSWYAGGAAADGPFWVWRSLASDGGFSCLGSPGGGAELLNDVPVTSAPHTFTDSIADGGLHCYWVQWDSAHGSVLLGPVVAGSTGTQDDDTIRLVSVWPNPSGGGVTAGVHCPRSAPVEIRVYSISGREVARPRQSGCCDTSEVGLHMLRWDGTDSRGNEVAAGVYIIRVFVEGEAVPGQCAAATVLR